MSPSVVTAGGEAPLVFVGLEDFKGMAGQSLGTSAWHVIDQETVDAFGRLTGDLQWIHVDPDRASAGPFGGPIAHGYLVLSMLSGLATEIYRIEGVEAVVNYGIDRLRFITPVRVGSSVRAQVTLTRVEERDSGLRALLAFSVEVTESTRPALVGELVALIR